MDCDVPSHVGDSVVADIVQILPTPIGATEVSALKQEDTQIPSGVRYNEWYKLSVFAGTAQTLSLPLLLPQASVAVPQLLLCWSHLSLARSSLRNICLSHL